MMEEDIGKKVKCVVHNKEVDRNECMMNNGLKCPWYTLCW
jgi:hypothetical protein